MPSLLRAQDPPEQCVVSILNRVAEVKPDGTWQVNNLPANLGLVRARFTCVQNGVTRTGQSKFFSIPPNQVTGFESSFSLGSAEPVPLSLTCSADPPVLRSEGATSQLKVIANLAGGGTEDVTLASAGTTYVTSNPKIATVSKDGLVTAVKSGMALISAMNENILSSIFVNVSFAGDSDGDGIPDDVEIALGLNPNNAADAREDLDQDGLTSLQEIGLSTKVFVADSDGDGVSDGQEIVAGTNPLDPRSASYVGLLASLAVSPPVVTLRTNAILPAEVTRQLKVTGVLKSGQVVDLTAQGTGTTYSTSDLLVVNFGAADGLLFAGQAGHAVVTVRNAGLSVAVPVDVTLFSPAALSFIPIPGQANNVDVVGGTAYIAAGAVGLVVVDVSNPKAPQIIGSRDTPGNGNDVRVIGQFAFLADGPAGLAIINVNDPKAPVLAGSVDTPGIANDVVVLGTSAYVADDTRGLQVIDLSNPAAPRIVGSLDTPGIAYGVDVDEARKIAVVADGRAGLQVIDISNPAAPVLRGGVDTKPGDDGGLDVVIDGTFAYVANGTTEFGSIGGLAAVDISDPAHPVVAGSTPDGLSNLWDVAVAGGLALGADNFSVNAVHTFNVTVPSTPVASVLFDLSQAPSFRDDNGTGIAVQGGFVYLTGVRCIAHHGAVCDGGLHIGQYLEAKDDLGIPPTVSIASPPNGAEVIEGSTVTVEATASDDVQVAQVQFFANDKMVSADSSAPFVGLIAVPVGTGSLRVGARAIDLGNNLSPLATIELVVKPNSPPAARITAPAEGSSVVEGSTVDVKVDATDDVEVTRVEIKTSTGFLLSDASPPFEASFTVPLGATEIRIDATAFDGLDWSGAAAPVTIRVTPEPPPTAMITGPADGATVIEGSTIILSADASDDSSVAQVEFSTSTGFFQADTSPPYQVSFTVPSGVTDLTVHATAVDDVGKRGDAAPVGIQVIPDPLTTVSGLVVDSGGGPVEGAQLTTNGHRVGATLPDGKFSIPGVSTVLGDIIVEVIFIPPGQPALFGRGGPVPPVRGGTTDVGTIRLAGGLKLLIIASLVSDTSQPPVAEMQASGAFRSVDFFDSNFGTPSLDLLSEYTSVLNFTDGTPAFPDILGNVLADYVDAGGRLVLSTYSLSDPWSVTGRVATGGYSPLTNVGVNGDVSGALTAVVPGDPVFAGVDFASLVYFHNENFAHPGLDAGATLLATDGAGTNMIARNATQTIIAMNFFTSGGGFGGNNPQLYQLVANALVSLGGGPIQPPPRTSGGLIRSNHFLALGPFANGVGCSGNPGDLLTDHLAPSLLHCQYPRLGDAVEYDPALASTTAYLGEVDIEGKPVWRSFHDLRARTDGDLDLGADAASVGAQAENVATFVATYLEYGGDSPIDAELCVGSDDGVQVWMDDQLVHTHNPCRGRGVCQDVISVTIAPGTHRILMGIWNGFGPWGGSLGIKVGGAFIEDPAPDWTFLGTDPGAFAPPPCVAPAGRRLSAPQSSSSCPPGGLGPVAVTLTRALRPGEDAAEIVAVAETVLGPLSRTDISAANGGVVTDEFPDALTDGGFVTAWLLLGPFSQTGGSEPGPGNIRLDYLTDGAGITQANVAPKRGDTVSTAFNGAAASTGLARSDAFLNPNGVPTWGAHFDQDDTIDFNEYYGSDLDDLMMYAVTYIELDADREASLGIASDDSVQVLIDGVEVFIRNVSRGDGGPGAVQDVVPLGVITKGKHKVMVKVFEGCCGNSFRLRFQEPGTGAPITEGLTVCFDPQPGPCRFTGFGARIDWNVSRATLAAGLGYEVNVDRGRLRFRGDAAGVPILGDSQIDLVAPPREFGPFVDPDFSNAHAIGLECPGDNVTSPQDGTLVMAGAGADVWTGGDQFLFAYKPVSGDFSAVVTVTNSQFAPGSRWGRFGIMARQDCSVRSRYSFINDHGEDLADSTRYSYRPSQGGADDEETQGPLGDFQHFAKLRLERCGSFFFGYILDDTGFFGGGWIEIGSNDWGADAPETVLLGLAVNSHQGCDITTITFQDWFVTPTCRPEVPTD